MAGAAARHALAQSARVQKAIASSTPRKTSAHPEPTTEKIDEKLAAATSRKAELEAARVAKAVSLATPKKEQPKSPTRADVDAKLEAASARKAAIDAAVGRPTLEI